MSLAESKRTGQYVLRIYVSQSLNSHSGYTVKVWRDTTVALVVQGMMVKLHLDQSRSYELVEVRRERVEQRYPLRADESPVERMLHWPEDHEESQRCYFTLQEGKRDSAWEPQDLCSLPVLNEKTVLDTLRRRFNNKLIYTYASNILVAINPFKFLPIYNPKDVEMYENCPLGSKEPHIFAIADAAFRIMLSKRKNQCIVISGESGSGKTQSTNFLIHCLTALSRKGCTSGVERTILGAGPVLEAFGNAKTAYNNNSSRFGKFIQVNFLEGGIVRGATIEKYLLEKCRLVSRKSNERNYHVFYYLLVGSTQEEKEEFKLLDPEDYQYLKQSEEPKVPPVQDNPSLEDQDEMKSEFKRLHQAMEMVGFLPATRKQIFSVLSAILYLGNVTYKLKPDGDGVTVGPADVLQTLSHLLKVRRELLVRALTKRKAMTSNDVLVLNYSLNEAITARDSMAKSLYSCLFDWIVLRINHALLSKRDAQEAFQCLSIGVLDIFGFEDFKANSFEQFCINYANEQLQYYCNQNIFLVEQEEYVREGICWTSVDFSDNIGCINLISKKPTGLLHLLDEESSLPHATDDTLLEKLKRQHQENPFFVPTAVLEQAFIIQHYAGKVKYQIKDFRAKNTDHVRPDLVALLRSSECGYLRQLIGSDPVAVFRWGILRATVRAMNTFKKAGHKYASEHPGSIKRYTRHSLGDMKRRSSAVGQLMSHRSLIDFSFDRSEENPLEILEDVFATYENKRNNKSSRNKQLIPKNLMDCHSLKLIVDLNLHSHDARALLHLHKKKKTPSISAQFQTSLLKLLETLKKAEPFFIRCIRSNAEKKEMHFDEELVLRQLRYTGMLETVRIKTSGYGAKFTFKEFMDEFRILLPRNCSSPRSDIAELLRKIGMEEKSFQIGRTKVFLKESERQALQETLHREVMRRILILQRWFRACLARRHFLMKKRAAIVVQRSWRTYQASMRYTAALVIQKAWRESHERAEYLRQRESLRNLQQLHMKRQLQEQRVSRAEESKKEITTLPRGKNKPLPPIPTSSLKENGSQKPLQNERQTSSTPAPAPAPAPTTTPAPAQTRGPVPAPSPARSDSYVESSPKSESGSSPQTLHRSKPSDMKEKVEKWRERRSEVMIPDNTDIKNLKLIDLKARGISTSLDNLSTLSSSESDGSIPNHPEVTIRRRKRSRHKPRLAHARSGLMLQSRDNADVEYWSFPLPPISPSGASFRVSAPVVLDRSQFPAELDGAQMSLKRQTEVIQSQGPQEKGGFFNRYLKKKRSTPQDGNSTSVKSLGEKEEDKSPQSCSPITLTPVTLAKRKRSIRISRGTRLPDQGTGSLDRQITDAAELRHLDEFLGNQMNDLQSRTKKLSETEVIFLTATTQFRDTIKSMYSVSNPQINYKGLLQGYKSKVSSLAAQKKKDEVPMVVNLFQSVLDGFIRAEIKRASSETELAKPTKKMKRIRESDKCPDSPLDHSFHTYQVTIMQSCDLCGSFIWGMEKASMCSSCKIVCHRKCMSKIMTLCSKNVDRKTEAGKATAYFGVHLSSLSSGMTPVPLVLEMMLAHVEMNGLYTEGIYRKSGSACKAKELHHIMETDPKHACLDNYQIHTITGLIKSWLRELPEPLMTFKLYNEFLYAADVPERSERLRAIYRKLEDLPSPNFDTLERLIFHLVRVVKEEPHNRMSANALAIVFAPCILRCPDVSDPLLSIRDLPKTTLCLEVLILEQTRRYEEKMKEIQQLEHAEALAIKELKLRRQNTIMENPRDQQDIPPMAGAELEKTLLERIKSIKHEKNKLACRLPELDQDASDYESQDSESLGGFEGSLENDITEGQKNTNTLLNCSTGNQTNNKSHVTLPSNQDLISNGRFCDLDIPFIDDDL